MIQLSIQGKFLDIDVSAGISVLQQNSLFNNEVVKGSRTYTIKLLDTPKNHRTLGFLYSHQIRERLVAYSDAAILIKGELMFTGTYVVSQFNEAYEGVFTSSDLAVALDGKGLRDVTWPAALNLGATSAEVASYCSVDRPDDGVYFPLVYNFNYYSEKNKGWCWLVNYSSASPWEDVNSVRDIKGEKDNQYSFLPYFNIAWLLQQIGSYLGYSFEGRFFKHDDLKHMLYESPVSLDELSGQTYEGHGTSGQGARTNYNQVAQPLVIEFNSASGYLDAQTNLYTSQEAGRHKFSLNIKLGMYPVYNIGGVPVTPDVFKAEIFLAANGVVIHQEEVYLNPGTANMVSFEEEVVVAKGAQIGLSILFFEMGYIDSTAFNPWVGAYQDADFKVENVQYANLNVYKKNLVYADHLPDISIADFLKLLRVAFNLHITQHPTKKVVYFDLEEETVKDPPQMELTEAVRIPLEASHRFAPKTNFKERKGITFGWQDPYAAHDTFTVGNGEQVVKSALSPLLIQTYSRPPFVNSPIDMWESDAPTQSPVSETSDSTSFKHRFCYPLGSGTTLGLNLNPAWSTNNLYRVLFVESYTLRSQLNVIELELDLGLKVLKELSLRKPVLIDQVKYLVDQLQTKYTDVISLTKGKFWEG